MSVGQELLDVPLAQMVSDLAVGVADAQETLDANSLKTTLALADETIEFVPKIVGLIDEEAGTSTVTVVKAKDIPLIAFIKPAWYQFSEVTIEVGMDIKTKFSTSLKVGVSAKAKVGFGPFSASVKVDVEHNRKFGKEVHGTSKMVVKMTPVPPPPSLLPDVDIRFKENTP